MRSVLVVLIVLAAASCSSSPSPADSSRTDSSSPAETAVDVSVDQVVYDICSGCSDSGNDRVVVDTAPSCTPACAVGELCIAGICYVPRVDAGVPDVRDAGWFCPGACHTDQVCCPDGFCYSQDAGCPGPDAGQVDAGCWRNVWADLDGDGYGAGTALRARCEAITSGFVARDGDCDDGNPAARPGGMEACDGVDTDCDGLRDDALAINMPGGPLNLWCQAIADRLGLPEPWFVAFNHTTPRCGLPRGDGGISRPMCYGAGSDSGGLHTLCWDATGPQPCR